MGFTAVAVIFLLYADIEITTLNPWEEITKMVIVSIWSHFEREAFDVVSQLRDEDKFETLVSVDFSRFLYEIKAHSKTLLTDKWAPRLTFKT